MPVDLTDRDSRILCADVALAWGLRYQVKCHRIWKKLKLAFVRRALFSRQGASTPCRLEFSKTPRKRFGRARCVSEQLLRCPSQLAQSCADATQWLSSS